MKAGGARFQRHYSLAADGTVQVTPGDDKRHRDRSFIRSLRIRSCPSDDIRDEGINADGSEVDGKVRDAGIARSDEDDVTCNADGHEDHVEQRPVLVPVCQETDAHCEEARDDVDGYTD